MKKKAIRQCTVFVLVLAMFCSMVPVSVKATESKKTVQAGKKVIVKKNVTVGKQLNISISGKEVTYKSSNSSVASVSSEGIVTGKKQGETEISVKKAGKKTTYYQITVKPRNNRPELPVALDEVKLVSASLKKLQNNEMQYSARVKNMAKKGTVRKIVYYYSITGKDTAEAETQVAGQEKAETQAAGVKKTVTLTAKKIKAGATSNVVSCEGDISGDVSKMKLQKVKLYTGEALYTYNVQKNKAALTWGTADKKAPVFSGWIGKNSYCGKDMFRICYTDRKQQYNFKKYVTAYDERDGKVKFSVDTRKINWKKEGVYKIKYTAKDKAGNKATAWAKVRVYKPSTAEAIADEVLRSTIKPGWSDEKKLRAIYKYIKKHCS
ncbi:MAG: DUF5011 domain-containing protein [Butyribacter sp.]|nr:Ig-like domain-containing protein [bacterium]MDY3853668.1 DUF5011 domain-containing protein [Butyribacter sp.]